MKSQQEKKQPASADFFLKQLRVTVFESNTQLCKKSGNKAGQHFCIVITSPLNFYSWTCLSQPHQKRKNYPFKQSHSKLCIFYYKSFNENKIYVLSVVIHLGTAGFPSKSQFRISPPTKHTLILSLFIFSSSRLLGSHISDHFTI